MREQRYEDEVSYLGSCLQIPSLALEWANKRGLGRAEIAVHFLVSKSLLSFGINMRGVKFSSL